MTHVIDSLDELPSFDGIAERWWVCAFKPPANEPAYWWSWVCTPLQPRPVINPNMEWRRPTYGEFLRRCEAYRDDPVGFARHCARYHEDMARYLRSALD